MSFLRRLFGGSDPASDDPTAPQPTPSEVQDAELAYERDLLHEDAARLSSDLLQRQLRYSDRSWTPPAEGGERRADDRDAEDT
jgi:hypothetical protein